jgi:protein-S-isoprenylcysteine O-methyltransferase Ste14
MSLRALVGSGDKIGKFVLPFLVVGVILNVTRPSWFSVGGPPPSPRAVSFGVLAVGLVVWTWSVVLILTQVPAGKLITDGPYALVRHSLYTGVAPLVLPWLGLLLDTWLGTALGVALYAGSRRYAPREEAALARQFGPTWEEYRGSVKLPWL